MLSFGLDRWEAMGFAVSAVLLVLLGMARPIVTGTRADPWGYRGSLKVGLIQTGFVLVAVLLGMVAVKPVDSVALLGAAVLLAFSGSLVLGLRMERALLRSVAEGS